MTLGVVYKRAASADVVSAYAWYESQKPELGEHFLAAVESAVSRAAQQPVAYEIIERRRRVRRVLTTRFPYAVYFFVDGTRLVVLAVLHSARDPDVWRSRP